jgi:putative ABC transport system substrate-binding protein
VADCPRQDLVLDRRTFLAGAGAALLALRSPSKHSRPRVLRRIGYLGSSSPSLEPGYVEAFRQQLHALGYIEGQHIAIEYRWAEGWDERLPGLAADLVRLGPVVIVTTGTPARSRPCGRPRPSPSSWRHPPDPVRSGIVQSLARPGGNVTGFTILGPELEGKRMELLKGAIPRLSRVAVLWNPANPGIAFYREAIETAGRALRVAVGPVMEVRRVEDLEGAFATIAAARPDALAVPRGPLPAFSPSTDRGIRGGEAAARDVPVRRVRGRGGLMSYAPNNAELFRGAATYVDKILKGAQPGNLPVQEPSKFELVINLKTARALGLTIPQPLLQRADRLIQ